MRLFTLRLHAVVVWQSVALYKKYQSPSTTFEVSVSSTRSVGRVGFARTLYFHLASQIPILMLTRSIIRILYARPCVATRIATYKSSLRSEAPKVTTSPTKRVLCNNNYPTFSLVDEWLCHKTCFVLYCIPKQA